MEISSNSETKLPVRRRLIQSTLVPHKSQDNVVSVNEDLEPYVDLVDEEEEYCGSQIQVKKNEKRKPKVVSQTGVSTKLAVNGNELLGKNTEEEDSPATVKCDFFLKVSEKRRQLRQQKEQLPITSPDKNEQKEDLEPDVDHEDDDEEYCGSQSQGKKNKKRKPKAVSQSRASRKLAVNGNEIGGKNTEEEDSPATVKGDFFLKVSERRHQQKQKKEQLPIHTPEKIELNCSPSDVITSQASSTPKKQMNSTPPRNVVNGALAEDLSEKMLTSPPKPLPDLQLEAKMTAEPAVNGNEIGGKNIEEEDSPATVKCDFFLKVSEKRQLRQQKEQLPINSSDKIEQNEDLEPDVDHEDDDEEYCGSQSQGKKNKKRKPKAVSQSRASRKLAVNGNEVGGKNTEEENSPATVKGDFFLKVSQRRNQRRQKKEQLPTHTPEKAELNCSPSDVITNSKSPRKLRRRTSSTPKKKMNSTPSRNAVNGALDEDLSEKVLTSPLKPLPDLRLEAKMTAEENSRIFAGKQIHPFFSSWKTGKKNTESTGLEIKWSHVEGKESSNDFSTFHIFEKTQGEETFSVDWRNWTFSEGVSMRTSQDAEDACLHLINEGSVSCLQFDNFLDAPPLEVSSCQNKGYSSQFPIQLEEISSIPPNYQPENSLWTTKYQPEKAIEICGNNESVKFLSEWLRLWYEKGSRNSKCSTDNDNWIMQGVDLNYSPTDSDSESTDEETSLKNVLLVTGPVGSGKSAAIYACAKEQGFQVIEVNTSDWRNGALVKQKFGEAVESHWLKCSAPNHENPDNKNQLKSSDDVIELIPLSDDEDSKDVKPIDKDNKISSSQNGIKTLILFEDIDATLYEDRGFISTIQQLAETAKRPMILTSNSDDPDLPNNLDRIEVSFRIPSSNDLLSLAKMVCTAEKAEINPSLVERFIDYCQGDIRKTIMLLQFWCQGQNRKKCPDNEMHNTYAPLLFDTNASHHVLPQLIPSGHTSKLSEIIEKEITKSSLLAEKYDNTMMEIIEEEDENIEAKKDEMLRQHGSDQEDENKFSAQCFPSCSSSPVAFTKRTLQKKHDPGMSDSGDCLPDVPEDVIEEVVVEKRIRRKYNSVMSSDSEDECFDVSCVPESTFVPETELGNGMCSDGGIEDGAMSMDITSRTVAMEFHNSCEEDKAPSMAVAADSGLDSAPIHGEEMGDSHVEPMGGLPREYQMMDECSRIDFNKKLEPESELESVDIVQETWRKLRNCEHELRQYVSNEEKDSLEALQISHGITNLISEADLLLSDCQLLTCDYLKPSMVSPEKSHSSSWHEDQLQMGSTIGQHGFCLYAKKGSNGQLDLSREMLAASNNAVSLGKLINQNHLNKKIHNSGVSLKSILESPISNTVQSIVPLKSQLSLKGYVFHEYLSTLSQISRSESLRFSEAINSSNQRRKRVARNYLSNGGLSLSSEDISLLDQYSCCQKQSSETKF
ncbi:uncharacterized protein LOC111920004 [Lactuca sativa]|uniref:AAA+ ATPase domain-containing protein n=1 Tax=Lactuca sativa TaxID=4236 RepID=A0A9R1X9H9_LACSA|nr:uncharacterized protein LOC111920004 [Lactuca sativa]KAJ0203994.1 hypothetical protein LSAT_V11C500274260 [Lactuca sativa]